MAKRRKYADRFKANVALEALRGDKIVQEIAAKHPLHPNQVITWKRQWINIFIERLWRSLKQKAIYLDEITDGFQARRVIKDWMKFYNAESPHSALIG